MTPKQKQSLIRDISLNANKKPGDSRWVSIICGINMYVTNDDGRMVLVMEYFNGRRDWYRVRKHAKTFFKKPILVSKKRGGCWNEVCTQVKFVEKPHH